MTKIWIVVLTISQLISLVLLIKLYKEVELNDAQMRNIAVEVIKEREKRFVEKYRPAMQAAMHDLGVESTPPQSVDGMLEMYLNVVHGVDLDKN